MVVRDPHYGILIFESNSNSGVCLTLWKSVISNRWYKLIPKYITFYSEFHGEGSQKLKET